jgi:hypothetical protein
MIFYEMILITFRDKSNLGKQIDEFSCTSVGLGLTDTLN